MATSGTVGTTVFNTQRVIDHAVRRCKLAPEQVTASHLQTALELLWLMLSSWSNKLLALWAIDRPLLALSEAQGDVYLPAGTLDVMNAQIRTIQPIDGSLVQHGFGVNNYYQFDFTSAAQLTQVGLTFSANATVGFVIQLSTDGASYTTRVTVSPQAFFNGQTVWYDITNGGAGTISIRIYADVTSSIQLSSCVAGNNPSDIPLTLMDRDTYANLPNKQYLGRPVQYYYDRQRGQPKLVLWPVPSAQYVQYTLISLYTHRQIQDVGTMQQEIEVPQRWYEAVVAGLASKCAGAYKEVDPQIKMALAAEAEAEFNLAATGETDRGALRITPNIRRYTR